MLQVSTAADWGREGIEGKAHSQAVLARWWCGKKPLITRTAWGRARNRKGALSRGWVRSISDRCYLAVGTRSCLRHMLAGSIARPATPVYP